MRYYLSNAILSMLRSFISSDFVNKRVSASTERVEIEPVHTPISVIIATDDAATVYVDGEVKITTVSMVQSRFNIDSSNRVIALDIINDRPLLIGFTIMMSNGIVSDSSWKCTDAFNTVDWMQVGYNDQWWPNAQYLMRNDMVNSADAVLSDISPGNFWVSVQIPFFSSRIFCRRTLR